jgi:hypothetical protein
LGADEDTTDHVDPLLVEYSIATFELVRYWLVQVMFWVE